MDPPSSSSSTPKPTWTLPIYESTPHYPPSTITFPRFPSSSSSTTDDRPPFSHGKEHMFDKVVTPSDVGKLNRLVIPKQHAEKHFPLDSNSSDKGLLLDFEDRTGKSWRFRYSYWNSSQSYVMTKGWSRFVKEKKLDAGDVVSFQRGVDHKFYIDWRRRPDAPPPHPPAPQSHHQIHFQHGGGVFYPHRGPLPPPPPPPLMFQQHQQRESHLYGYNYGAVGPNFGSVVYMRAPRGSVSEPAVVFDSVPVVQGGGNGAAAAKRLRLFGVTMDCTVTESANVATNSSEAGGSLELRLDGRGLTSDSSMSTTTTTTTTTATTSDSMRAIEFLEKGKSSMSLDFDI